MQESVYDMSTTESSGIRNDEDKIALEAEEGSSNANPSILDNLPSFQAGGTLSRSVLAQSRPLSSKRTRRLRLALATQIIVEPAPTTRLVVPSAPL